MLVDPDREKVDFRRVQFELPADAWHGLRRKDIEPRVYYAATSHGTSAILHVLCLDLKSVLNDNSPYWEDLQITDDNREDLTGITDAQMEVIDRIATLLDNPDIHLDQLRALREQHEYLR